MQKKAMFMVIALLLGCFIIFVVIRMGSYIIYSVGLTNNPQKILSVYKLGSSLSNLSKNEKVLREFVGPLKATDIAIKGYALPKRGLDKGEKVLIIDRGEWVVYLYYDSMDILTYRSISGS